MFKVKYIVKIITYVCVVISFVSVFDYLETYHLAGFLCLCLCSLWFDYRRVVEIPRWLLNGISLGVLLLSTYRVTPEYLIEPMLDALIILVAIKLLEEKKIRDYMQIYTISMFLLIGSTLISMSITFLLYLSLFLALVTISLILLAYFSHNPEMTISQENLRKVISQSLLIFAFSIPLSMFFFVILPRTAYPFLNFLNKAGYARSGFTDTIFLGQVAEIQEDNAAIFRAEMEQVGENQLYWRGVVLDQFDGARWTSTLDMEEDASLDTMVGRKIGQTIYLEPYGNKYLFALDKPISFSIYRNKYSRARIYPFKTKIFERIRYRATSRISFSLPQAMIDRKRYLQIPDNFAPKFEELVRSQAVQNTEEDRMETLLNFIQHGKYEYALENLPVSETPLEDFLFVHKRGNCEYFASSLAVMLRMAGIPARLIGGYRGGYYNNAGKYYLVTQRNAHVWVEAFLSKYGWVRLDPTPPLLDIPWSRTGNRVLLQLRLILDTFNYYWYKVIIDYDFSKQLEVLNAVRERVTRPDLKLHLDTVSMRNQLLLPGLLIGLVLLLYTLIKIHKNREERVVAKFLHRMAAYGYEKQEYDGLEEFVNRVEREDIRDRARLFVEDFEQVFYRDRKFTKETVRRLMTQIKRI
jgi:protein-glutamine gamma-glutamyltransferase